ncbi:MAG: Leukocyte receptor cluster (LRC) member 8 [Thelocarpon impressellum]|nr:MAG: Leukocyte receptor cluster (LRC) member 8 [Thelocarpon impressellum]
MSSPGAFHSVDARRSFQRYGGDGSVTAAAPVAAARPKKVDWPQPVRDYVQRAFLPENGIPGIQRTEMESKLKETITQANERDSLHTIDWKALPLPQQLIQSERAMMRRDLNPIPASERLATLDLYSPQAPGRPELPLNSKKRKSSDLFHSGHDEAVVAAPWRKASKSNGLHDRVTFADGSQPHGQDSWEDSKYQEGNLQKRQKRFENGGKGGRPGKPWATKNETPPPEEVAGPVVGRSEVLEKKYFRLTAPPNPDTVRPLAVLHRTLEMLKRKWRDERNYSYVCDQFKSLRQDLTVQHIKTEFTVNAYEIHARIALEKGDLGEYNQCQTQLRALYSQKLGGHPTEFKAYRILYFIHTCNRTDMNDVLADLTPAEKKDAAVKHALDVRSALALGNYHAFFRLYLDTPNMGAYLMDMFVVRERLAALANMCRAYKPDIKLRFVTEELGFESDGECVRFLCDSGAEGLLDEREDGVRLLSGKAGAIFDAARAAAFRRVDIKGQI